MSDDGVYPSSVPYFLGDVEFEDARSRSNFECRGCPLQHYGDPLCVPSDLKLVDRNSESYPKFEVRMS